MASTQVDVFRAVVTNALEVVAFEDIQGKELRWALVCGRIFIDSAASVINEHGFFHLGRVSGEIFVAEQAAILFGELRHRPRDIALVEPVARGLQRFVPSLPAAALFRFDELSQGARQVRIAEDLARLRRLAVGIVHFHAGRVLLELLRAGVAPARSVANWKSVFGEIDGRRQHLGETHRAPTIQQDEPGIDDSRHGSRQKPIIDG